MGKELEDILTFLSIGQSIIKMMAIIITFLGDECYEGTLRIGEEYEQYMQDCCKVLGQQPPTDPENVLIRYKLHWITTPFRIRKVS
jgi:hypothetical protein